jgi:repressor LexA
MLTRKQLDLYESMKAYKDRNGIMPSYDEMADMIGLKSKSGIHRMILALEDRGAIYRRAGRARAISLRDDFKA